MDNLTHTAIGLFLSRTGPGKWSPRGAAIMMVAANIPDADVVSWAAGRLNYLNYHRHLTHSLLLAPLMAFLAVALVRLVGRKPVAWKGGYAAALLALASHLLLDWTNVYGIRLLLPFSSRWLRADTTGVIDLWIWAVLAIGIAGPFLSRMVGAEIGGIQHPGVGFVLLQIGVTIGAQPRIPLHQRRRLLVLEMAARALHVLEQTHVGAADVDMVGDDGVADEAFLVANRLERSGVAGIAFRADRLMSRV